MQQSAGSFRNAVTVLRLRGVPVRVDWSWLLIAGLVTWVFYNRMSLPLGGEPAGVVLVAAAAAALLFFASLLAHEVGHAFTSLDRGIPVLGITLFLLGGVTESTREARTARHEFVIVGIGPFISLTLAAAFGLLYTLVQTHQPFAIVVGYLAWANLLLAIFNVVPAYPLDGGRLLRSVLWGLSGRPHAATRWAARVGQAFALALGLFGAWVLVSPRGGLGGIWELLIAVFLFKGASDAHARARLRERLQRLSARDVMGSVPAVLDPDASLHEAVVRVQDRPSILWPVGEPVQGAIALEDFDRVPRDRWWRTTVGEVAHPAATATIEAETSMEEVLERIVHAPRQMLIVTAAGRPVGLLTPSLVTEPTRP
jgi:Zn-dependent protease/CBS domain-containing protein